MPTKSGICAFTKRLNLGGAEVGIGANNVKMVFEVWHRIHNSQYWFLNPFAVEITDLSPVLHSNAFYLMEMLALVLAHFKESSCVARITGLPFSYEPYHLDLDKEGFHGITHR